MKSSDLYNTLTSNKTAEALAKTISQEVAGYALLMTKRGASNPLYFDEDMELILTKSSILKLLSETHLGNLTSIDLAYICDCLTLGERVIFDNESVEDIICELADPEINGGFRSPEEILSLLTKLEKN